MASAYPSMLRLRGGTGASATQSFPRVASEATNMRRLLGNTAGSNGVGSRLNCSHAPTDNGTTQPRTTPR
eukprot:5087516-Alexandrium_andersonii.AAC.1